MRAGRRPCASCWPEASAGLQHRARDESEEQRIGQQPRELQDGNETAGIGHFEPAGRQPFDGAPRGILRLHQEGHLEIILRRQRRFDEARIDDADRDALARISG